MRLTPLLLVPLLLLPACAEGPRPADALAPATSSCEPGPGEPGLVVDYVPFVQLDGVQYVRTGTTPVPAEQVGEAVGTVACTISELPPSVDRTPRDGDAAFLPVGTPVHALAGAPPGLRVLAEEEAGWQVYEAVDVPAARTGGELLDLRDVVRVHLVESDRGEDVVRTADDPAVVARVVEAVRAAPLLAEVATTDRLVGPQWFVRFELAAGPPVQKAYWPEGALLHPRVEAPAVLREALGV